MSIFTVNGKPVKYGNKWLATDGGTPSSELPPYDSSDAGKALVVNNEGDNVVWQTVGSSGTVDQHYDGTSTNAQSGTAVAEAISGVSQVPSSTQSDENKVLTVNSSGVAEWATAQGGTTYTAGNMISLANDTVAVSTTAGVTDVQFVNALPANPVATVLYLIRAV